jgi:hypothetical protein
MLPQLSPAGHDLAGVHPHTFGVPPPPHVCGDVHDPQGIVPPQPSGTVPQLSPAGHDRAGVHPHTFGVPPPPHVCGDVHDPPQASVPPQPSEMVPQLSPAGHDVLHPHTFGVPPPPHVCGGVHVPQPMVPSQLSDTVPQLSPLGQVLAGPVLVHLPWALLQSCCTVHVRPDTVIVSPGVTPSLQMSPISPQSRSYQPSGGPIVLARPTSVSVAASASSCDAVVVEFSSAVAFTPQPTAQALVYSSIMTP